MTDQANAIVCIGCGSITETELPEDQDCPVCLDRGDDPWCVVMAVITPCPATDQTPGNCDSDEHDWGRGDHVREIES